MRWWRRIPLPVLVEVALAVLTAVAAQKRRKRVQR